MGKHQPLIDQMTLEEKVAMLSGSDSWHTQDIARLGAPKIMMTDGPHGLRKVSNDNIGGLYNSAPATCFPTASLTACSWDESLLQEMGDAIAEEALQEGVSIVLGPGVNIKRSPLCGRNFEYFSEDPLLAGKMAGAWIRGVEKRGIGASLKHFAVNNQEYMRMVVSAEVDERALREIYLRPFEIAVKEGHPTTLMCAYNKLNGEYCSSNTRLLTTILRDEWGYDGLVMSDWGAVHDRVAGIRAGMDLEMPSSGGYYDQDVIRAVNDHTLDEACVDKCVDRVLSIAYKGVENAQPNYKYDVAKHEELAMRIAMESAVLLRNNGDLLPLNKAEKVLVIGELARIPRYQGGGSSHIAPIKVTSLLDGLDALEVPYQYLAGYSVQKDKSSTKLTKQALAIAENYDKIVLCIGLTEDYESEGFDRKHLALPQSQLDLIHALRSLHKRVAVVYYGGSPVVMDFLGDVDSVLSMYLSGGMGGIATAKLLYGEATPCGKLAESWPTALEATSCYYDYNYDRDYSFYTESLYVGYRYYDSVGADVQFPFGHGLSYNSYDYSDLKIANTTLQNGDKLNLSLTLANNGDYDGKEVVEVYIQKVGGKIFAPYQELKAFSKISLDKGESKNINISIDVNSLRYYDTVAKKWLLESGDYVVRVGASSRDIRQTANIHIDSVDTPRVSYSPSWYTAPTGNHIESKEFIAMRGFAVEKKVKKVIKKGDYTSDNTLDEISQTSRLAKIILSVAQFVLRRSLHVDKHDTGYAMMSEMFKTTQLCSLSSSSQGAFSREMCNGVLTILNGKFWKGISQVLKANKTRKPLNI